MVVMLFETINFFFGSFDELNMHYLRQFITIPTPKHMLSKSCKGAPKVPSIFATKIRKKRSFLIIR